MVAVFEEPAPNLSRKFVNHAEMLRFGWWLKNIVFGIMMCAYSFVYKNFVFKLKYNNKEILNGKKLSVSP